MKWPTARPTTISSAPTARPSDESWSCASLLPERRNQGLGARLLEELIAESDQAGRPVNLQVLKTNPALHLYQRLGFVQTGEDQMYFQMERAAAG